MKIILDAMGFENSIKEPVIAARKFLKKFRNVDIIFVGDQKKIKKYFKKKNEFQIIHTEEFIEQSDDLFYVMRNKKNSSMMLAIDAVNKNKGDVVVSAGSTPCFVGISYYKFGLINNISKAAFTPSFPSVNGVGFNMLDVGANIEVDHNDLVQFALMSHTYVQKIKNIQKPSIGILNIGTEENKGVERNKLAHKILKKNKEINYIGFVEPRDILKGNTNIIITDGFTGNICLKTLEGSFKILLSQIKNSYKMPWNWLGALLSILAFAKIKKTFDYKKNAGAVFLGLNKIAIKTHGSADWQQFYSSFELAKKTFDNKIIDELKGKFSKEN